MEHSGREYIQQVTRDDALAWRADELSRCQGSTVKTRLRFLNGLFGVAQEERNLGLALGFLEVPTKKFELILAEMIAVSPSVVVDQGLYRSLSICKERQRRMRRETGKEKEERARREESRSKDSQRGFNEVR